ncbi:MAG: ABC transporter ATP-binding protein [Actinomycetota bacterium]|nr:ABC transporter ATP-binding protein [Actinomycetota bacterium]
MGERVVVGSVDKLYAGASRALDAVSMEVDAGTVLVLLGPSGSGKTTLLRCIAGIERVSAGEIVIGEVPVAADRVHLPPERRNLSMVFQDYALWPHMVARDNVAFALKRRGLAKQEARARALEMLARVGLGHLAGRYPSELSGGEQQRVALARALVGGTGLVLFDEPLSNLDADLRERMRIEISSLVRAAGATAIYITHDQSEAFALADRVGVLEKGRLVQFGVPEEIYAAPASPFVARFTGLAGELAVRSRGEERGDGTLEVEATSASSVRAFRARVGQRGARVERGTVMIRPTAVRICHPEGDEHHLVGRVADVAFRGRGYEHAVELACGTQLSNVFADVRVERGESVALRLEVAGCMVFSSDEFATMGGDTPSAAPAETRPSGDPGGDPTLVAVLHAGAVEEIGSWK